MHNTVWLLAFLLLGLTQAQTTEFLRAVTIRPVDQFGRPLEGWSISEFLCNGRDYSGRFRSLRGEGVPNVNCTYTLSFRGPNSRGQSFSRGVGPSAIEHLIVPLLPPEVIGGYSVDRVRPTAPQVLGQVRGLANGGDGAIWVRFNSVYGDTQLDADVDSDGKFRLYQELSGVYQVAVLQAGQILATQLVSATGRGPIQLVIQIPPDSPDVVKLK